EWWVQAEALVGLLEAYTLLEDIRYWQAFLKTLDFIEKYQIATEGGWRATLEADGRVIRDERASMWQGPYHTGRALLHCAKILESQRLPLSIRK
ncbi:MAG TPA: AGE family epimerase/isomerase, partial [Gemmatales bacterium]|nr:AGE family epimerase/isomerase [Gemmatales bacterium]